MPPPVFTPSGGADEAERDVHVDLLAGDELLEVHMEDRALDRVTLQLANQGAGGLAVQRELDDGARDANALGEVVELAGVEGEGHGFTAVAVDDAGDLASCAQLARDALARLGADFGVQGSGCHCNCTFEPGVATSQPNRRAALLLSGGCVLPTIRDERVPPARLSSIRRTLGGLLAWVSQ
jgi:hypothetical protein